MLISGPGVLTTNMSEREQMKMRCVLFTAAGEPETHRDKTTDS